MPTSVPQKKHSKKKLSNNSSVSSCINEKKVTKKEKKSNDSVIFQCSHGTRNIKLPINQTIELVPNLPANVLNQYWKTKKLI
jgi:hypothetical protein